MTVKILHTSDWHLDSVIYGKRSHADVLFKTALEVIDIAKQQGCVAIINSGDTLNSSKVGSYPIYQLDVIHNALIEKQLAMYTLTGNHDMDTPQWISRYMHPDNYGIVSIDNTRKSIAPGLHVYGFMTENKKEFMEQLPDIVLPKGTIGVWHNGIVEFTGGGNYLTVDDIFNASPIKTWLMGDIHVCRYIQKDDKLIGYPGPIGMIDVTESPDKFVVVMEIDTDTGVCVSHEQIKLTTPTPLIKIPLTNEQEYNEAEQLLKNTAIQQRVIWFHFDESMEAAMSQLMVHTNPNDVVRHRNITPRFKEQKAAEAEPIINSKKTLREVGEEVLGGLQASLQNAGMSILTRSAPHQVIIEKLITEHENSFN